MNKIRFYTTIIEHKKTVIISFLLAFLISAICYPMVAVNYDINDYLPENAASTEAINILEQEYSGGIPNLKIMLTDVSVAEVLQYKEEISNIEGVTDVLWIDDVIDPTIPIEMLDEDVISSFYKDSNALLNVTIDEDYIISACEEIKALIGEDNAMSGAAASSEVATVSTINEVRVIAIIAVIFIFFVLFITTTSYAEPIIIMIGLGIAVIINAGSNLIFGEISFVTNAAGNILQLAVSLDYSVFLLHRFEECRRTEKNVEKAMIQALSTSTKSILSSGLTTVIGFLALCLMQFQIGPDLGYALAKGIAISLITVFVFMPVLVLYTYKWLDKTEHPKFLPSFRKTGNLVYKMMIPMVILFAIVIVPSYLGSMSNDYYYGESQIFGTDTELGADTAKIESVFGKQDTYVLLIPNTSTTTEKLMSHELSNLDNVSSIISYVDTVGEEIPTEYLDSSLLSQINSPNYTRLIISVNADYEGEETFALVEDIRTIAEKYYPEQWYLAGEGVSTYDLKDTITKDMVKVNFVAIGAVFLVLLLTMKSPIISLLLVLSIECAVWFNLAIPYFKDQTVFYISYLIISSVQLGATVDYAILLTERYKECRETLSKKDSVVETISAVTVSIMTSASVLTVVGFLLGKFSTHGILSQLGIFLGIGTICSLVSVIFVLPGLLYIFDRFFIKNK